MKTTTRLVLSIVFIALFVGGAVTGFILGVTPQLGLDLQGGISVVLEAPAGTPADVMNLAVENIRNRVDATGVAEASISVVGDRDIQVEVPGITHGTITRSKTDDGKFCAITSDGRDLGCRFDSKIEANAAIQAVGQQELLDTIGTTARLEERQVTGQATGTDKVTGCPGSLAKDPKCNDTKFVQCPLNDVDHPGCTNTELATQTVVFLGEVTDKDSQTSASCTSFDQCPRYKLGPVEITGDAISKATAQPPDTVHTSWWVQFTLNSAGSAKFAEVTTRLQGQQLAIILDREVKSAPTIQNPITAGSGEITGSFSESDAKNLAKFLRYGALPVELARQNVETVSPTLGKQSLHQGLIAGVVGLVLLMLYLAFYYRLLGVVTWFGMSIWAIFALSLLSALGKWGPHYALSLAGIAGIIVSMGITADSYIVFYERLKDEVRHGKTLRAAVQPAFKRAWRTIYTADIVTGLAAAVLYLVSVGSVRGFAFTLGIATLLDLGVVYFFKRPTVFLIARSQKLSNMRGIGLRSGVAADPDPIPVPVAGGSE
jgi:preprotein translocase subunit SecD